jgi:hypothetical protein
MMSTPEELVPGLTRKGTQSTQMVRPPPPMRVVYDGWLSGREETRKTVDELQKEDRERELSPKNTVWQRLLALFRLSA